MAITLPEGIKRTETFIVEDQHIADFLGSGSVAVLSTPSMISMMENTARLLAQEHLPEGWVTVGTRVDVRHLKPARKGAEVTVTALLKTARKNHLIFAVEAYVAEEKIGEGIHERHIINKGKFMRKISE